MISLSLPTEPAIADKTPSVSISKLVPTLIPPSRLALAVGKV
jgi:hypothetical protein